MEFYYTLVVGVLFLLAILILIVGVSNDAVNFLNSALGSKAATFRIILLIAAAGVLVGAVFSNGMMEVARKGIFNPEYFAFNEIMVIFLAVMLTNILLLDFFNTFGMPTSTTVSVVFAILGAAVAVSITKISRDDIVVHGMGASINIESSVMIIVGIFLSVAIAFTVGIMVMWIVRMAFSFNLKKSSKFWSGIWGGIAITAISFFLLIKGAKGSSLVTEEMLTLIKSNTVRILIISLIGWTILFQILASFTKVNILKITVLVGTFALAMAFAGNDMVNFIGVPMAGFESYKAFTAAHGADAGSFMMESLTGKVDTAWYFLVIAGLIMVVTLRFSKKAKSVTETEINLGRQGEGSERFASSGIARFIVRRSMEFSNGLAKITPKAVSSFISKRFDENRNPEPNDKQAFDLVRASVNLVVASILISIGTSLKLPLSTTYVTFMVAMGTSLSDGAWGRESAVYRITGVLTVIGGWFFTAFIAFSASFLIATLIFFGKLPAMLILIALAIFILLRTHAFHRKRAMKEEWLDREIINASYEILKTCDDEVKSTLIRTSKIHYLTYINFFKERFKEMKGLRKDAKHLIKKVKEIRENLPETLKKFEESQIHNGHHYVHVVAYMKEMSTSLSHIVQPAFEHLDNNHPLDKEQIEAFREFNEQTSEFFKYIINLLKKRDLSIPEELNQRRDEILETINEILVSRIKILKKTRKGVKVSVTYLDMLSETKNLVLHAVQLVKAHIKFRESLSTSDQVVTLEDEILD